MSIETINLKFKSGNNVPVERTIVTREEWEQAIAEIDSIMLECCDEIELLNARIAELESAINSFNAVQEIDKHG